MLNTIESLAPYIIFAYGSWTTAAYLLFGQHLESVRIPDAFRARFVQNRVLGWVSLVVGALWVLQDIFIV